MKKIIPFGGLFLFLSPLSALDSPYSCEKWLGMSCWKPNTVYDIPAQNRAASFRFKTNAYGWRQVRANTPGRKRFLLLFGGSNTSGTGISDGKTIGDQLARRLPNHEVYNYAHPGWGPAHSLAVVRHRKMQEEVKQPQGIALFHYYSFHLQRTYPNTTTFRWLEGRAPRFVQEDGKLIQKGTFARDLPLVTSVLGYFGKKFPRWEFPVATRWDRERMCSMLVSLKQKVREDFPGTHFAVAVNHKHSVPDTIAQDCLKPMGISYFTTARFYPRKHRKVLAKDGHLNAKGAKLTGDIFADWLKMKSWVPSEKEGSPLARRNVFTGKVQ